MTDKDTFSREVLKDFQALRTTMPIDWQLVQSQALRKVKIDETGSIHRGICAIIASKINREVQKANIFSLEADLEYALVNKENLPKIINQIKFFDTKGEATLLRYKGVERVAELIGSRGPNKSWGLPDHERKRWKRPELHRLIASSLKAEDYSTEFHKLLRWLRTKLD